MSDPQTRAYAALVGGRLRLLAEEATTLGATHFMVYGHVAPAVSPIEGGGLRLDCGLCGTHLGDLRHEALVGQWQAWVSGEAFTLTISARESRFFGTAYWTIDVELAVPWREDVLRAEMAIDAGLAARMPDVETASALADGYRCDFWRRAREGASAWLAARSRAC